MVEKESKVSAGRSHVASMNWDLLIIGRLQKVESII
jgi:hypothetical protein